MSESLYSVLRSRRDFLDCSLLGRAYSVANWAAGTSQSSYSVLHSHRDCWDYPSLRDYSMEHLAPSGLLLMKMEV
jgi:hypothetical protein